MLKTVWRTAAMGVSTLGMLVMAACSASDGREAPPPPVATEQHADRAPDLLGGPPAPPPAAVADHRAFPTMAPIANPRDMTPAERERVYGHRYDYAGGYGHRHHGKTLNASGGGTIGVTTPAPVVAKVAPVVAAPTPAPAPVVAAAPAAVAPPPPVVASTAPTTPSASVQSPKWDFSKLHLPQLSLPAWLSIPGVPMMNVPGVAHPVPSKNFTGGIILLLAILLLIIAARGSGSKKPRTRHAKASPTMAPAEVAEEPAPLPVAHEGPSFQADDFGGRSHVEPAHVEPAHAEPVAAEAALPEALAVHFDPPAAPAAEPEAAPVYAEAPAAEAMAHEAPVAEAPAGEAVTAAEPVAAHAPDHIEVLTPETFNWQSLTHPSTPAESPAEAAPVAEPVYAEAPPEPVAAESVHAETVQAEAAHEAPEALGHEALKFSDHAFPAAEPARESEHV